MTTYIELLAIACIWVIIIDLSGFIQEIESLITGWFRTKRGRFEMPKPFSCSLCMTWWTGLIYLLITGECTVLNILAVLLIAYFTPVYKDILLILRDASTFILNKIQL